MMGVRSAGAAAAERPLSAEGGNWHMWWQHALSGLSEWLGEDCFFGAHACACVWLSSRAVLFATLCSCGTYARYAHMAVNKNHPPGS